MPDFDPPFGEPAYPTAKRPKAKATPEPLDTPPGVTIADRGLQVRPAYIDRIAEALKVDRKPIRASMQFDGFTPVMVLTLPLNVEDLKALAAVLCPPEK